MRWYRNYVAGASHLHLWIRGYIQVDGFLALEFRL
jgi:hypothetical protein